MDLSITEEQEGTLLHLADKLRIGGEFSRAERIEMAFVSLLDSVDTQIEAEEDITGTGEAIDAEKMKKVIQSTLNPNISLDNIAMPEGAPKEDEDLTFGMLMEQSPENPILLAAEQGDDIAKAACERVFNSIPEYEWRKQSTAELVSWAADELRKKK